MNVFTTHWCDLNRTLVENPETAVLWLRALRSFEDLDAKSKLRFGAHLGRFLRFADNLYLNVLDGPSTSDCGADMNAPSPIQ
jgi:hypothetical protein